LHRGLGPPDIEIRHRLVPVEEPRPDTLSVRGETVQFTLWNIRFSIRAARTIAVEAPADVEVIDVRIYLLGSIMAALLQQRGYLPIHANLVRHGASAAAFAGESGAGKSSLAAWLDARGHEVLSDDLCAIRFDPVRPMVFEGIPRMKLWSQTLQAFNVERAGLTRVATDLDKYHVPLRVAERLGSLEPVPLERVYILEKAAPGADPVIEPLTGTKAAEALLRNIFRWDMGQRILDNPRAQFDQCLALAQQSRVFRVRRRWGLERFDSEAEAIERHLETPLDELT
jgi:hypothetical protein